MKKIIRNKKGFTIQDMLPLALTLLVAGIGLAIGAQVLDGVGDTQCGGTLEHYSRGTCHTCPNATSNTFDPGNSVCHNGSPAVDGANATATFQSSFDSNITSQGQQGIDTFAEYLPTVALVVVASIVIGVLVYYLAKRMM